MAAHTSTGQWQSFELRMRRRRAERLLLRADAAADAGFLDEAREALAEARHLEPSLPDVARLEQRLKSLPPEGGSHEAQVRRSPDPTPHAASTFVPTSHVVSTFSPTLRVDSTVSPTPRVDSAVSPTPRVASTVSPTPHVASTFRWKIAAAAGILLIALSGALGYYAMTGRPALQPSHEFYDAAAPIDAPLPSPATPAPTITPPEEPQPVSTTGTTDTPETAAIDAVREPGTAPSPVVPAALREDTPPRPDPKAATSAPADRSTAGAIADPPEPSAPRTSGAPSAALPAAPAPTIPIAPPPPIDSPAPSRSVASTPAAPDPMAMQSAVRTVLDRYAAAYSELDADAAQRVRPGVNRDELARAFDSLASQRVSLGACSIDVTGARAHAQCAGSTTWRPKVGDAAMRTDARTWTFELAKAGADWTIVSARVQNR